VPKSRGSREGCFVKTGSSTLNHLRRLEQVLQYLGRHTHGAAISNHRLISLSDGRATFRWRDSLRNNEPKLMTVRLSPTETQTLGGAGFSALAIGKMIRKDVSKGISTGIKATHGKGLGTKRTTRISATPTTRKINIILPNHFRFSRFIFKSLLRAGELCTDSRTNRSCKWILQDSRIVGLSGRLPAQFGQCILRERPQRLVNS